MKASAYKGSDYLKTQKDVVAYLNAASEDGEPAVRLEAKIETIMELLRAFGLELTVERRHAA